MLIVWNSHSTWNMWCTKSNTRWNLHGIQSQSNALLPLNHSQIPGSKNIQVNCLTLSFINKPYIPGCNYMKWIHRLSNQCCQMHSESFWSFVVFFGDAVMPFSRYAFYQHKNSNILRQLRSLNALIQLVRWVHVSQFSGIFWVHKKFIVSEFFSHEYLNWCVCIFGGFLDDLWMASLDYWYRSDCLSKYWKIWTANTRVWF